MVNLYICEKNTSLMYIILRRQRIHKFFIEDSLSNTERRYMMNIENKSLISMIRF